MGGKKDINVEQFLRYTIIKEIMIAPAITIQETETLRVAQETFIKYRLNHLVIVDETKRLSGIISQKYLYKAHSPRKIISQLDYDPDKIVDGDYFFSKESLDAYILKQIMKKQPVYLKQGDTVFKAIRLMSRLNLGCIPIVDNNKYVKGTLTDQAIVKFFSKVLSAEP